MIHRHNFRVAAPLEAVAAFHARPASMAAITPPPLIVRITQAPAVLCSGDKMTFTLWMGPLPVRWVAQIEEAGSEGFADRQLTGPFAEWRHQHRFMPVDGTHTLVRDEVHARLRRHWLWGPVGAAMWAGLPLLFAYRGWRTRRLLATGMG
jgi:ligand-binding SRPBCC domain-containing protein